MAISVRTKQAQSEASLILSLTFKLCGVQQKAQEVTCLLTLAQQCHNHLENDTRKARAARSEPVGLVNQVTFLLMLYVIYI